MTAPLGRIVTDPLDVGSVVASVSGPGEGAVAVFVGTVRDHNAGRRVLHLEYEAYRPMAEREMRAIGDALAREIGACRVAIVHRIGRLEVGEASIVIAVGSEHRRVALAACSEAIERVKRTVPIWKKEYFEGGAVWIEGAGGASGSGGGSG